MRKLQIDTEGKLGVKHLEKYLWCSGPWKNSNNPCRFVLLKEVKTSYGLKIVHHWVS